MYPSVKWFGDCVFIQTVGGEKLSESQLEGKAYIDQNHDKIFSLFMDFVDNSLELALVGTTGILLNIAFVFGMAQYSERTGIVTLFVMEFL